MSSELTVVTATAACWRSSLVLRAVTKTSLNCAPEPGSGGDCCAVAMAGNSAARKYNLDTTGLIVTSALCELGEVLPWVVLSTLKRVNSQCVCRPPLHRQTRIRARTGQSAHCHAYSVGLVHHTMRKSRRQHLTALRRQMRIRGRTRPRADLEASGILAAGAFGALRDTARPMPLCGRVVVSRKRPSDRSFPMPPTS